MPPSQVEESLISTRSAAPFRCGLPFCRFPNLFPGSFCPRDTAPSLIDAEKRSLLSSRGKISEVVEVAPPFFYVDVRRLIDRSCGFTLLTSLNFSSLRLGCRLSKIWRGLGVLGETLERKSPIPSFFFLRPSRFFSSHKSTPP